MSIKVKIAVPKRAEGEYETNSMEDLIRWLLPRRVSNNRQLGEWLYQLVKQGSWFSSSGLENIDIRSDFSDYCLARKWGEKTGLVKFGMGKEQVSQNPELILAFAKAIDEQANARDKSDPE